MWSSTSVLHLLQGVTCSAFRDALGGYLSYSQTSLREMLLTGYLMIVFSDHSL